MADNLTTTFPKMGEDITSIVNISGQRSPYTMPVVKSGFAKSDVGAADPANKKNRGNTIIRNASGPRCRIVETIDYPNERAESAKTYRNVKRVHGGSQFYSARAAAGSAYAND